MIVRARLGYRGRAMADLSRSRDLMVDRQIRRRGLTNNDVLAAMRAVPREAFVPDTLRQFAYEDSPLPIEAGQSISQPFVVAMMIDLAEISRGGTVLEIGAGSGYAAAVAGRIAEKVHAIERHAELAAQARERMEALGYGNVEIHVGDGTRGLPEHAPFDAVIVSAGSPAIPQTLKEQLEIGGVLVMPVGDRHRQQLVRVRRLGANHYDEEGMGFVAFVPMVGEQGWPEEAGVTRSRSD